MEFLKNIGKEYGLSLEYDLPKKLHHYLKLTDFTARDVRLKLHDLNMNYATFKIASISNMDEYLNAIVEKLKSKLRTDVVKYRRIATKMIHAWETTPENFKQKNLSYSRDEAVYINSTVLNDVEYHTSLFVLFMKYSKHIGYYFTTGCGENTHHGIKYYRESIDKLDKFVNEVEKDLNKPETKKKFKIYLLGEKFEMPMADVIKYITIPNIKVNSEKRTKKNLPKKITINGAVLNDLVGSVLYRDEPLIDENVVKTIKEDHDIDISYLMDWMITDEHDGEHHHDSDTCEYTLTLTSPDGHEYSVNQAHSLITGYNFFGDVTFE